jgi:hypothetical protein
MKFGAKLLQSPQIVVATALIAACVSVGSYFARPSALRVDGMKVSPDVPPVTQAHEAYVPLRAVGDTLGAEVSFDTKTGVVEIVHGRKVLRLRAGDRHASIDGSTIELAHAPFTVRGRTMVSQEVIARAFGSSVKYDAGAAKIDVITPRMIDAGAQELPAR